MEKGPAPIDQGLLALLGKSKAVMQKTEAMKPIALSENSASQVDYEDNSDYKAPAQLGYTREMVNNSKLPDAIKKLMTERPIPIATGLNSSVPAMYDENDEKELPDMPQRIKAKPKAVSSQPLNESRGSDMITISKSQLDTMINEKLLEFFAKAYNKTITENAISTTIKKLIAEGVITTKKKVI